MGKIDIRITPIEPDCFYHIYNRGVNSEIIFKSDRNYQFFFLKMKENLLSVCDVYAYCLMPNHFHLLVKIKSETELIRFHETDRTVHKGLHSTQNIFSKQFSKIFNSYSQAFNKENKRHGSLIESPFKRKLISSEEYLKECIIYIHQNPENDNFRNYNYSSYKSFLSDSKTYLMRSEVLKLFGDKKNFIFCHNSETDYEF